MPLVLDDGCSKAMNDFIYLSLSCSASHDSTGRGVDRGKEADERWCEMCQGILRLRHDSAENSHDKSQNHDCQRATTIFVSHNETSIRSASIDAFKD